MPIVSACDACVCVCGQLGNIIVNFATTHNKNTPYKGNTADRLKRNVKRALNRDAKETYTIVADVIRIVVITAHVVGRVGLACDGHAGAPSR